jgi:hypothetical protein
VEDQQVEHQQVEQQPTTERKPAVALREGALRWWLQTVSVYLVVMYLSWTILDLTVRFTPSALAGGLYTSMFTFVLFGIPSLFLIGVVRLVEPKLPRWGFTVLATLTSLLPLLIAPDASLRELLVQLPAQLSLIGMLHLPAWTARRSRRAGFTPPGD